MNNFGQAVPPKPSRLPKSGVSSGGARWKHDLLIALASAGAVAVLSLILQNALDDRRSTHETRLENLRFVREKSSPDLGASRPFQEMDLEGQNLSGLSLSKADMQGAIIKGGKLPGTDLREADLSHAKLKNTSISRSNFAMADLSYASVPSSSVSHSDMRGANLHLVNFQRTFLKHVDLTGADLTLARLEGALLENVVLTDAKLIGVGGETVCYDDETTWPEGFSPPPMNVERCEMAYDGE